MPMKNTMFLAVVTIMSLSRVDNVTRDERMARARAFFTMTDRYANNTRTSVTSKTRNRMRGPSSAV